MTLATGVQNFAKSVPWGPGNSIGANPCPEVQNFAKSVPWGPGNSIRAGGGWWVGVCVGWLVGGGGLKRRTEIQGMLRKNQQNIQRDQARSSPRVGAFFCANLRLQISKHEGTRRVFVCANLRLQIKVNIHKGTRRGVFYVQLYDCKLTY